MKNILDVIYDYSRKRKILDEDAIEKIIKEYISEFNISIVNNIYIIRENKLLVGRITMGHYADDYIEIFYSRIMAVLNSQKYKSDSPLEKQLILYERVWRVNLFIAGIVCHELEHAMQEELSRENNPTTFEDKLILLENHYLDHLGHSALKNCVYHEDTQEYDMSIPQYIRYSIKYFIESKRYDKLYDYSLLERLADVDSSEKLYDMLYEVKSEIPHLYPLLNQLNLNRKLRDYDESELSPTLDFFTKLLGEKHFDYYDMPEDYTLDERLRLGLPISASEYNETIKKLEIK